MVSTPGPNFFSRTFQGLFKVNLQIFQGLFSEKVHVKYTNFHKNIPQMSKT